MSALPISVIVTTKNEEANIAACLEALGAFDDVWVVDSNSGDGTQAIAKDMGTHVENYSWDGGYPKKRQWCLDNLALKYERVFFVDGDEIVPPALVDELAGLDPRAAGYFVQGFYRFGGKVLKHGLRNNKLALFDRRKIEFPIVDDLDIPGMGEMEGHYQPVLKTEFESDALGQIKTPLIHNAYEDAQGWTARHERYARWEAGMNAKNAWPVDPRGVRQLLKVAFRKMPFRGLAAFIHCYVFKLGFLDGRGGYRFAGTRARYYRMISYSSTEMVQSSEASTARLGRT